MRTELHNGRWAGYRQLLWARLLELSREPEVIFWVIAFPLILTIGLGIAFRRPARPQVRVAVVRGPRSAWIAAQLARRGDVRVRVLTARQAARRFRMGDYDLIVAGASAPSGASPGLRYNYDPSRPTAALARARVGAILEQAAGRHNPLPARNQTLRAPGTRYIDFLIPGLLGMNLMNSGMWGIGFALVEMRQRKLLKRLIATPMHRGDFLLALGSSRLILMLFEVGLLLGAGVWLFHMPIAGSLAVVVILGAAGAISFGGLGLLTACRAVKIESISGLLNAVMMPMWVLSGVFFSYRRFPRPLWPWIRLLPLTAVNDALRSVILQGQPLSAQGMRLLVLALWGGLSFVLALKWFRWQ